MTSNEHDLISEMVDELLMRKNILLEGPPGTGKTYQVSTIVEELRRRLEDPSSGNKPVVQTRNPQFPFGAAGSGVAGEQQVLRSEWVTFHESFTYEEFVLGRRPEPRNGVVKLVAHAGMLLDLAISVDTEIGSCGSAVLIIDEINRANAGRVIGEFMTFLDMSYRATVDGHPNPRSLRPQLAGLRYGQDGQSEEIILIDGRSIQLPRDWLFPENVYVIATMNSVDKGALPLDSALLRRFKRFFIKPDAELLARHIRGSTTDCEEDFIALICSLFKTMNDFILANLGRDHLLGHALLWDVVVDGRCSVSTLARVWDRVVFPQLLDRFVFNVGLLSELLHRDLESTDGLLAVQQVSDWDTDAAADFFASISNTAAQ
jgi:5-methylcytosine-specific restriction protein B